MKQPLVIAGLITAVLSVSMTCGAGSEQAPEQQEQEQTPHMKMMSAEFMKKVMETSARIEAVKQEIADREQALYKTNPEVKEIRARMIEMQKKINRILEEDKELARLKMERDIVWSLMPAMPSPGAARRMPPPGLMLNR